MVDLVSKARRGSTLATTPQREEKTHLLYGVPDHVARDVHLALLPQPDGACDGLALDAGVPLQLDDEDAVGAGEVEPESFSSVPRICTRGAIYGRQPGAALTYPNPPVPVVMISTGTWSSCANRSSLAWRCERELVPSTRI